MLAFDTETALIRPGCQAPPLVCVSTPALVLNVREGLALIREGLETQAKFLGHNIAYDFAVLGAEDPSLVPLIFQAYDERRVHDTQITQKLIDIATGAFGTYSLAVLAKKHLGVTLEKADSPRLTYGPLRDVPIGEWSEAHREYARLDAEITQRVYQAQVPHQYTNVGEIQRQTRSAWWVHLMSCWGMKVDPLALEEFIEDSKVYLNALANRLLDAGLLRKNRTRNKKAAEELLLAVVPNPKRTAKGNLVLDGDACRDSGEPLLIAYAEYQTQQVELGRVIALRKATKWCVQSRFNSLVKSGRMSCSKGNVKKGQQPSAYGFQIHNMPRKGKQRSLFVPREGHVFVGADYSGLEMYTVAQVCLEKLGKSRLAEVLNAGRDPHSWFAAQLLDTPYEEFLGRLAKKDPVAKAKRQFAKEANFGFPGGMGAKTFVARAKLSGIELDLTTAYELREAWLTAYPEFRDYYRYINSCTCADDPTQYWVEHVFSGRIRSHIHYTEACNSLFQGLGSDVTKEAGAAISYACYAKPKSPLYGCRIVNCPHDEFILEVPEDRVHEAGVELVWQMVAAGEIWTPNVPLSAEPYAMRRWHKDAEGVYDENGRLVPWEP